MNPGDVVRHRKQTTHYLGGGHYLLARQGWFGGGDVIEITPFNGSTVLAACPTRSEAELLAAAYAAMRGHQPATNDRTEA